MPKLPAYVIHEDSRGCFMGITQQPWAEVNFIQTGAGQVRGDHYHKQTRELFFIISGEIDVVLIDIGTGIRTEFTAMKGDIFIVEPYIIHTFSTKIESQWINMLSQPIDKQNPDFHKLNEPI